MKLADLLLSSHGDRIVAAVTGEIDMSNAAELHAALRDATPNDAAGLALDLTRLDYLDSAGIQLLFKLNADLQSRAQRLALVVEPGSVIDDTFRLAGVSESLRQTGDTEQALALLASEESTP